jgi:hypothetical protein
MIGTIGSVGGGRLVGVLEVVVVPVVGVPEVVPEVVGGVVVVVPPVLVVVPVVVVLVVGGGEATTVIVAVMKGCRSQWKVYVPGVLNVHEPLHPGPVGWFGTGGTGPLLGPDVCAQLVGSEPRPKSALCALDPEG